MELAQNLCQSQSQILSAQQIQSMEILQMGTQELVNYIQEKMLENPVVEMTESRPSHSSLSRSWEYDPVASIPAPEEEETLYEHIMYQARRLDLSPLLIRAVDYAARCLDHNGYISEGVQELAQLAGVGPLVAESALEVIQGLEPAGVGARDLGHSIALQLRRLEGDTDLAETIAENYLGRIARGQYGYIAAQTMSTELQIMDAVSVIRSMNPRPCRNFAPAEGVRYIIPDVVVQCARGELQLNISDGYIPKLSVSEYYSSLFHERQETELQEYLSAKIKEARWLIGSISRRRETLYQCAYAIADYQKDFFTGKTRDIRPLILADIADELGIHLSTVSRAVNDKYIKCDSGVYPLNHFLSRPIGFGNNTSIQQAKLLLADMIADEDEAKPLSDMSLSNALLQRGCPISRRTIAKYRAELGIPPAVARRKLKNF